MKMFHFLCKVLYRAAYGIAALLAILGAFYLTEMLFLEPKQFDSELGLGIVFIFWLASLAWLAGYGFHYVSKSRNGRRSRRHLWSRGH